MKYTFEAYFPDGSPRRYIGSFRPPREECERLAGYRSDHGFYIPTYNVKPFEDAIATGRFDRPLYAVEDDEQSEENRHWLIHYEDADAPDEVFTDEVAARTRSGEIAPSWNHTLFVEVEQR